jgi:glycosyltransferase involved in cell wall biosynthesis
LARLTGRRARGLLGLGLRDPVGFLRGVKGRGIAVLLPASMLLPTPIRQPLARPLAGVLERAADRRPGSRTLPSLAFIARFAAGPPTAARDLAVRIGTAPATHPRARRGLALLARDAGMRDTAVQLLVTIPDDRTPEIGELRARAAYDAGDYSQSLELAREALAGGAFWAQVTHDLALGHLTTLQPDWAPDLGPEEERLRRVHGQAVKGRVLHLVASSLPYRQAGYTVRTRSVVTCQAAAGLEPHVATRAGFPRSMGIAAPAEEVVDGIPHHRLSPDFPHPNRNDLVLTESARAAARLIERLRPAVLQPASNHDQAEVALALARPLGIPVVYELRGFWEETWLSQPSHDEATAMQTERYRMIRAAETAAALAADAVVTIADTMRAELVARGCPPEKVVVVPNAVDIERFTPAPRDLGLAAKLGIDPADQVVGYVSTFSPYEGIRYLLEAVAIVRGRGRRLRVLLVGDGIDWDALVEAGQRLGLDDGTLVMPGRVPHEQVNAYYSLIDVFVVPRTADRVSRLVTPLKPFEAMALERAVVVSDLPALREIVTPGETGMTFAAEDADDLARVLDGLLDDPALRTRLGRAAREWIIAERTWAANGRRYRELFERLGVA